MESASVWIEERCRPFNFPEESIIFSPFYVFFVLFFFRMCECVDAFVCYAAFKYCISRLMAWNLYELNHISCATWPFCFYTKFWKKDKKIATDCMCKRWCKWNEWMCLLMSVRNEKWHRMKWTRTFSYIKSKRQYRITISFCHLYNNAHFWNFIFTLFPHNVSLLFRVRSLTHSFQFLCVFFSLLL